MKESKEECYFCGEPATSKEHVPPKCIFPEKKDSLGYDFRRELITVPSCDEHNTVKADDDEFLFLCLAGNVSANVVGQLQRWKKIERAREKHKWNLEDQISERIDKWSMMNRANCL